jgi:hypothetical protein
LFDLLPADKVELAEPRSGFGHQPPFVHVRELAFVENVGCGVPSLRGGQKALQGSGVGVVLLLPLCKDAEAEMLENETIEPRIVIVNIAMKDNDFENICNIVCLK